MRQCICASREIVTPNPPPLPSTVGATNAQPPHRHPARPGATNARPPPPTTAPCARVVYMSSAQRLEHAASSRLQSRQDSTRSRSAAPASSVGQQPEFVELHYQSHLDFDLVLWVWRPEVGGRRRLVDRAWGHVRVAQRQQVVAVTGGEADTRNRARRRARSYGGRQIQETERAGAGRDAAAHHTWRAAQRSCWRGVWRSPKPATVCSIARSPDRMSATLCRMELLTSAGSSLRRANIPLQHRTRPRVSARGRSQMFTRKCYAHAVATVASIHSLGYFKLPNFVL